MSLTQPNRKSPAQPNVKSLAITPQPRLLARPPLPSARAAVLAHSGDHSYSPLPQTPLCMY
jgi:hypothetical protein